MQERRIWRSRRFLLGFTFGIILGMATLFLIGAYIPESISTETASNFFFAATGVNATLLVAISVMISAILNRTHERNRRSRMLFFLVQLIVVFIGLIVSGMGILIFNPSQTFDHSTFVFMVNLTFTTWVIGFVLLISGIWVASLPDGPEVQ